MIPPPPTSTLFPYTTLFRSLTELGSPNPPSPWRSACAALHPPRDRKSTRLNSSHVEISYAVFCLKKKNAASRVLKGFNDTLSDQCLDVAEAIFNLKRKNEGS